MADANLLLRNAAWHTGVAAMTAKLQGTLGERIKQAYKSHGWSRMEFWRRAHKLRGKILYGQIIKWEHGATPDPENLQAIAEASGYAVSDFTDGHGVAHAVMSSPSGRDAITRFMQSGELAPFTDGDLKFLESCVAAEPQISQSKLRAGLLGFRVALGANKDAAAGVEYDRSVRQARSTSALPPPMSKSTAPKPPRRRRRSR